MNRDELEAHLRSQLRELHESLPVGAPPVLPRESSGRGARTAWLLGAAGAAVLLFLAVIWVTRDNGSQTVRTGESPTNPPPTSGSVQPTTSGRSDAAPAATGLYVFQPYVVAETESTLTAVQTGPGTIGVGATLERWQGDKWVRTHDLIVGAPASYDGPTTVLPAQTEVACSSGRGTPQRSAAGPTAGLARRDVPALVQRSGRRDVRGLRMRAVALRSAGSFIVRRRPDRPGSGRARHLRPLDHRPGCQPARSRFADRSSGVGRISLERSVAVAASDELIEPRYVRPGRPAREPGDLRPWCLPTGVPAGE